MTINYITIKLPEKMINEVMEIIKENPELAYDSRTQYIKDIIREKIIEYKKSKQIKNDKSKKPISNNQSTIPIG